MNVKEFLRQRKLPFEVVRHRPTYDAQRLAHEVHVSGYKVAKTVLVRSPGGEEYAVAVLDAAHRLDLDKLAQSLGWEAAELATEIELAEKCPDCELGVLPPFGSKYALKTVVDEQLAEREELVFEADRHDEAIRMSFREYRQVEEPRIAPIAQ